MDTKDESKSIFTLCEGCLSTDRKLKCVTGQTKALFIKLREDVIQNENETRGLSLCWECIALLNKMKYFQARVKTAQYRLMQYLQTFYDNKRGIPHTLSLLIKTKHKEYDYNYKYLHEDCQKDPSFGQNNFFLEQKSQHVEQKDQMFEQKDQIFEQKGQMFEQKGEMFEQMDQILEQKGQIFEQTELAGDKRVPIDVKVENNEIIKEEIDDDNISLNSGIDYYEPELKQETDQDFTLLYTNPKKGFRKLKSRIKKYEELATVTKINSRFPKNVSPHYDTVFVSSTDVEKNYKAKNNHRFEKNMPYKCSLCKIGYNIQLDYMRHKTFNHGEHQFPSNCKACNLEILSESHLEEHWKNYHNPMLSCRFCGELSRTKGELVKHLNRSHTKLYTCNTCSLEFRTLGEFSKHYVMAHERVTCDYCNRNLCSKRKLETHIKKKHLPGHCTICNKDYPTYHTLELHLGRVHPELVPHLIRNETSQEMRYCVECDIQYPTITKYKKHLQQSVRHRPKKKVRIPCPACDKIFTRVSYKNNHYRLVHIKESKHYCELCNKYFTNGYGVRKHIQHVHQKIPKPKDKICDLCGRGFSSNRILHNHRRTHTGERPFKCPYCPASFAQVTAMKTHQKSQHKNILVSS